MLRRWLAWDAGLVAIASLAVGWPAAAQSPLPACEPPRPAEFLLLVRLAAAGDRDKLALALPPEAAWALCRYQDETVARIGGFQSLETASNWGRYTVEIAGLPAFVARPPRSQGSATALGAPPRRPPPTPPRPQTPPAAPATPPPRAQQPAPTPAPTPSPPRPPAAPVTPPPSVQPTTPPPPRPQTPPAAPVAPPPRSPRPPAPLAAPSPTASANVPARYAPRPLGEGYAVLVDYFQRPALARSVQQVTQGEVGLAAYFTRPYLLATYTRDAAAAQALLRQLSDRGFSALIVNSNQVMLLAPRVRLP